MPLWAAYIVSFLSVATVIISQWDRALRLLTTQLQKLADHIVALRQVWTDFRHDLKHASFPTAAKLTSRTDRKSKFLVPGR